MSGSKLFLVCHLFISIFQTVKPETGKATLSVKLNRVFTNNDNCSSSDSLCGLSIRICLGTEKIPKHKKCDYEKEGTDEDGWWWYEMVWEGHIPNSKWSTERDSGLRQMVLSQNAVFDEADRGRELDNPITFQDFEYYANRIYTLKVVISLVTGRSEEGKANYDVPWTRTHYREFYKILHHDLLSPSENPLRISLRTDPRTQNYLDGIDLEVQLRCMSGYFGCVCDTFCLENENYECDSDGSPICNKNYYPAGVCTIQCIPEADITCDSSGNRTCIKPGYKYDKKTEKCTAT